VVFLVLETIAIVLLSNNSYYQHSRLINASREVTGWINERFEGLDEYLTLRKTNQLLVQENTRLRNRIEQLQYNAPADTVRYTADSSYSYQLARVVQRSVFKQHNYITLNKGRKQGIHRDMAVIGDGGIVGIVLESSKNFSTVIPIINRDFRLSAKIKKNNYSGVIEWSGDAPESALLNEIPYHVEVETGDSIVTSGYSSIFPEGLFVGTIQEIAPRKGNFLKLKVALGTNFFNLHTVNVITYYHQEEQRTLENSAER
jgi:rod shape-determining protein MreC